MFIPVIIYGPHLGYLLCGCSMRGQGACDFDLTKGGGAEAYNGPVERCGSYV